MGEHFSAIKYWFGVNQFKVIRKCLPQKDHVRLTIYIDCYSDRITLPCLILALALVVPSILGSGVLDGKLVPDVVYEGPSLGQGQPIPAKRHVWCWAGNGMVEIRNYR